MKKIKIVTIGGGSSYTPELIEGFIKRRDRLNIGEIWLVDIESGREKLEIVGAMAKRMIQAAGLDWDVKLTLDRVEALENADFVTTQFRVGRLDARIKDERIPAKYGMLGQETNGAGGIFKAFRTIPVILDIISDMKELCPNAWLVNFTNPAGMVTEAAINVGGWKRTVGLCNVPVGSFKKNHEAMGYKEDDNELFMKFAGLNHFHWHRVWDKEGNEITDILIERMHNPNALSKTAENELKNIKKIPFIYEQIKSLNMLPCGYHRYYYMSDEMLGNSLVEFEKNETRAEVVKKTEAELFELYKDPELDYKPEQLTKRGGSYYSDSACELVASIVNNSKEIMVVSTANKGSISDLPYNSVVEVSSVITSEGPEPITWGSFPSTIRGQLQLMKSMEETVIEAAIKGDYSLALQAFTINPLIVSGNKCKAMLNEMLVANKDDLPNFKQEINKVESGLYD
ncbi:6-phospho-beta-glucosidase [Erysipelothrix sp. HDW6A]|uniref:6-phospho-beta-glucosidase n=1 Tax=Erysipelothrix sp. HDW6A TaxID=2714928 RepID=UPI0014095926|nr:6-phospho-beta-glucosidase [Erysipelothrix sp. HDW6A]QIK57071.1 6-phospho-beta-glucosidase [Erysipelothrix sp. HDW6A]